MRALTWLGGTLLVLVAALGLYAAVAHWAWGDIPAAEFEARYAAGTQVATVDGVAIRYRLEGAGPPLVLVHSHYFDLAMWDAWMPALASGHAVLRYDLTGHGLTGPDPSGIYTVDRDVALLRGLLARLGLERVAIVGSSLGGNIAFTFAAREPARVRALVLANSGGLKRKQGRTGKDVPGWAGAVLPLVPPAALRTFLRWMVANDALVTDALAQRFVDGWRREGNRAAELARLRQFEPGAPEPLLAAVTAPTLVLWGEANPQLPVTLAEGFRQKLTGAARVEVRTYPGVGHALPLEQPSAAADVIGFLKATAR